MKVVFTERTYFFTNSENGKYVLHRLLSRDVLANLEMYLGLCQTSMVELSCESS